MQTWSSLYTILWSLVFACLLHQSTTSAVSAKDKATSPTISLPHTPSSRWSRNEVGPLSALAKKLKSRTPPSMCSDPTSLRPDGGNQCAYYESCLEARYHCGGEGYPLGYGKLACESLTGGRDTFDDLGKKWVEDKEVCIQQGFGQIMREDASRRKAIMAHGDACGSIEKKGLELMSKCFLQSGLCGLGERNWGEIVKAIGSAALRQQKDTLLAELKARGEECNAAYEYFFKELNLYINHAS